LVNFGIAFGMCDVNASPKLTKPAKADADIS
jgi:hypothetical protein